MEPIGMLNFPTDFINCDLKPYEMYIRGEDFTLPFDYEEDKATLQDIKDICLEEKTAKEDEQN